MIFVFLQKADSLNKMYEMDDNPDRRMFLDKLIHYMEENNSPIASCPTISKNPLDLFKLYLLVKERGGFLEVRDC
jgi:AT-rich interactive domain-containing protein 1